MSHAALNLNPGETVDNLQVERLLSVSEHSAVYVALDEQLNQRFVLKQCLPASLCSRDEHGSLTPLPGREAALARSIDGFRAAGRLQAGLEHPAIPRVLRYFETLGTAWMMMEWRPGMNLERIVGQEGPMTPVEARALLTELASALAHLHERGALHLAITPGNVYRCADGQLLLLDYRCAAAHAGGAAVMSEPGPWVPPERLQEPPRPVESSDLYALCALAHFCLTGSAPATAELRQAALQAGQPDPLAALTARDDVREIGGLGDAIDLGLRLDPSRRPQDIAAWRQDLASIEWRRAIARSESPAERERPEWLSPLLLGALLSALVLAAFYLLTMRSPPPPAAGVLPEPQAPAESPIPEAETRQWQAALQADTLEGYRRFLEQYPESRYRAQAQVQVDILDERAWAELSGENSLAAYRRYLELFPAGLHEVEALARIDRLERALSAEQRARAERERQDQQAWLAAREGGTVAALDAYLGAWPGGQYADQARALRSAIKARELESRAWSAAVELNTQDAYQAYLDAYPDGEHSAEALITIEHLDLSPGKAFRDCASCPPMVVLPPGGFYQGASEEDALAGSNERPSRLVNIPRPFAIGIHEVTFAEWDACVDAGGCSHRPGDNGWGRDSQPVIMVSWDDAQAYVNWLSEVTRQPYRLPSESEWEYAARAGEDGAWPGGELAQLCQSANIAGAETGFDWRVGACGDGHALGTLPVGSLQPNAFGLHDVIGNVAEWTADCMNISYLDAPVDGSAWTRGICSSHMTRGGSWVTGGRESRLPARFSLDSGDRNDFTGFRVVRSVEE